MKRTLHTDPTLEEYGITPGPGPGAGGGWRPDAQPYVYAGGRNAPAVSGTRKRKTPVILIGVLAVLAVLAVWALGRKNGPDSGEQADAVQAAVSAPVVTETPSGTDAAVPEAPAGSDVTEETAGSDLDRILERGTLIVGVTDYPPFTYVDDRGEWTGFDADLARAAAELTGVEVEFSEIDFDRFLTMLDEKSIDCFWSGIASTEEREEYASFTEPYLADGELAYSVACRRDSDLTGCLNAAIRDLYADGTVGKIAAAYDMEAMLIGGGQSPEPEEQNGTSAAAASERAAEVRLETAYEGSEESGTVTGYAVDGSQLWQVRTGSYEAAQLSRFCDLGIHNDMYYYVEDGNVVTLDLSDGSGIWTNTDFYSTPAAEGYTFRDDGVLYITGYYGPDLCVIDKDGNTVYMQENMQEGFECPVRIVLDAEEGQIGYEFVDGQPSGGTVRFRLDDYSVIG